ncbi:tetratricopeptide repeat protein [bacterium]|nr:tetratricopeptide repeat protein [bacterium]
MKHTPIDETSKADDAFRRGKWKDAEDSFQRIIQRVPECLEAWLGLAEVQAVRGEFNTVIETLISAAALCETPEKLDDGLQILARILEFNPYHEATLAKRIDLLFGLQRTTEGIAYSRELAQYYLEGDHGETAIQILLRAFQLNPKDHDLISVLAEAYLTNGQMREASGLFRQIIPHYIESEEFEKATLILRRLSLLDPKEPRNFMEAGQLYIKMEKFQEADQQFRAVLRIDLNHREALLKIAEVSLLRKLFRDASMVYNRLISLSSDDAEAHEGLGLVFKGQGMQADAAKHLLLAGLGYSEKQNNERAHACFAAVLEIDPSNNIAGRQVKLLAPAVRE